MATIDDINVTSAAFVDVYAQTSIAVGSPLVIQNKSSYFVRVVVASSQPAPTVTKGWIIEPYKAAVVENESEKVWIISESSGNAKLSVQQFV